MKRFLMAAMSILLLAACKENEPEKVLVESIAVTPDNVVMTVGDKDTLSVGYVPENAENKSVVWSSSDEAIVTVEEGVLTAVAAGDAVITADCDGVTDECTVTVNEKDIEVESVELNKTEAELVVGETFRLEATVLPEEASGLTVTWSSSASEIVSVDDEGNVSALSEGKATITAEAGGVTATCDVTVSSASIPVESVTVSEESIEIKIGETFTLTATVLPENAEDKTVTWSSSDNAIATVSDDGVVTDVAVGNATIVAAAGQRTAVCSVKVSGADSGDDPIADIKTDWTVGELFDVPQYGKGVVFQVGEDFIKVVSMVENIYRQYSLYDLELKCTDVELADGKSVTDDIENAGEIGNYPAMQWCRGKGDLWYLPTLVELEELYSQSSAVNATLAANGSGNLPIMVWSCIESDATYAWAFVAGAPTTYTRMQSSNVVAVMKLRFK